MKKVLLSLSAIAVLATFTACNSGNTEAKTDDAATVVENAEQAETPKEDAKCGEGKCGEGKCGEGKGEEKVDHFASIDTDGNGEISKEEFAAHIKGELAEKDTNKDGKITKDECGKFDMFNTDGNDFVSEEEFAAGHEMMFKKMDTDASGSISKAEMEAQMKAMHADAKDADAKCGEGKCGEGK